MLDNFAGGRHCEINRRGAVRNAYNCVSVAICLSFISITMPSIMIDLSYLLRLKPRWNHAPRSDSQVAPVK